MFKKILEQLSMGTKSYILLKEQYRALEKENFEIREHSKEQICGQIKILQDKEARINNLEMILSENKKNARRAIREINKMNDEMAKEFCREIIRK